jgi:hypothetical protein
MSPFCFKCHKEMSCLKTGFVFEDDYRNEYVTDLFFCTECMALATNSISAPMPVTTHEYTHYHSGEFTVKFLQHIREWYPIYYERFCKEYECLLRKS